MEVLPLELELRYPKDKNGLYRLDRYAIEEIATSALEESSPANLNIPMPLNVDSFLEDYQGLMLKYAYLGLPGKEILGATVMANEVELPGLDLMQHPTVIYATRGTVLITTELGGVKDRPRQRYTKMHEAAHWMLHSDQKKFLCRQVERYRNKARTTADWREWQADALAAALLMPKAVFHDYAKYAIRRAGAPRDFLEQGSRVDHRVFNDSIGDIATRFGVSHRAAQIRMIHLGLIRTAPAY